MKIGGSIGVEYIHIPDREQCDWIRQRIETPTPYKYTAEQKHVIFDRLTWSDSFERFIASKYPSEKRFGLEGGETLIPGMKAMVRRNKKTKRLSYFPAVFSILFFHTLTHNVKIILTL